MEPPNSNEINRDLYLLLLALFIASCSTNSINGNWQLHQVDLMDVPNQQKRFTLDISDQAKMKEVLYKESHIGQYENAGEENTSANDSTESRDKKAGANKRKAEIDNWVRTLATTSISLAADSQFYAKSNGLIIPTVVPGWQFGNSVRGNYSMHQDTLVLSPGAGRDTYQTKFKVLQLDKRHLELQEVFDGFKGGGNRLRFVRQ